jgi:hypothetical protein
MNYQLKTTRIVPFEQFAQGGGKKVLKKHSFFPISAQFLRIFAHFLPIFATFFLFFTVTCAFGSKTCAFDSNFCRICEKTCAFGSKICAFDSKICAFDSNIFYAPAGISLPSIHFCVKSSACFFTFCACLVLPCSANLKYRAYPRPALKLLFFPAYNSSANPVLPLHRQRSYNPATLWAGHNNSFFQRYLRSLKLMLLCRFYQGYKTD